MAAARTRWRLFAAAGLAACALLPARSAAGQSDGPPPKTEGRAIGLLVPPEQRGLGESLVVAAGAGITDLDVEFFVIEVGAQSGTLAERAEEARGIAASSGAFAVVWIDPAEGGTVYAIAAEGDPAAPFVRHVGEADPAAQIEAMAVIIRTAIEQLLSADAPPAEPPIEPPVAPPIEPPVAPPIEPPVAPPIEPPVAPPAAGSHDRAGLWQETEYAMHVPSAAGPCHGVNLRLGVSTPARIAVFAGYTVLSPQVAGSELGRVQLKRHPVHLGANLRLGDGRLRGFVEASLIADYVVPALSALDPGLRATNAESSFRFSALLAAGIGLHFLELVTFYVGAGAEIPFDRARYVIGSGARERALIEPWPIQPWLLAGLMLDLL